MKPLFVVLGTVTLLLLLTPIVAVTLSPVSDLPQQLAQVPLFGDAVTGDAPDLRIQWLAPNKVSYPLFAVAWSLLPPLAAARGSLAMVAAVWVASIFWLAARRGRPSSHAMLASVFLYSHLFGFGFFNFVVGLAAFLVWVEITRREADGLPKRALWIALGALLLYWSHALWLLAGLAWLAATWMVERPRPRVAVVELCATLPALVLAGLWYPHLQAMDWQSSSFYGPQPWARLSLDAWSRGALGAIRGPWEPALLLLLVAWLGCGLWQRRRDLARAVDRRLLAAALLLLAGALLLPEKLDKTLAFATRWQPMTAVLLVLALPAPVVRPWLRRSVATALVAGFALVTATVWRGFEREELAGLAEALAELPAAPRVLGLDYYRSSPRVRYPAYLQMHAYAQLVAGGRLNFSFTDLASSLVVRRDFGQPRPWTPRLEWRPDHLVPSDLDHFDVVLVHAPPEVRAALAARSRRLVPMSGEARWRLFSVEPTDSVGSAAPPGAADGY